MITITRERLLKIQQWRETYGAGSNVMLPVEEAEELACIALASLDAEPDYIRYDCGGCGWETIKDWRDNDVCPKCNHRPMGKTELYTVPPVQETGVYKDMLNIIGLLENNEWAEHCTSTVLGSLLESEITRLVSKELSAAAPVVPEDLRRSFEAVARLNNEMYRWTSCMSYNGSYVGEPEGLLKRNIREIERILDRCKSDKGE